MSERKRKQEESRGSGTSRPVLHWVRLEIAGRRSLDFSALCSRIDELRGSGQT